MSKLDKLFGKEFKKFPTFEGNTEDIILKNKLNEISGKKVKRNTEKIEEDLLLNPEEYIRKREDALHAIDSSIAISVEGLIKYYKDHGKTEKETKKIIEEYIDSQKKILMKEFNKTWPESDLRYLKK